MIWGYIIIGAGPAGCAAAAIAEREPAKSILVIGAGPLSQMRALSTYDWGYASVSDRGHNGQSDNRYRGRVLGGSSSIGDDSTAALELHPSVTVLINQSHPRISGRTRSKSADPRARRRSNAARCRTRPIC
jgi:glycine/D-amino acid oxidase-like deaminating enzyme